MKVIVLGAGVIGVTSAWSLAQAGHEVTVLERNSEPAMETSFANGGQISAGHAEPWAKPAVLPKILHWLGREDAPLLFRARADRAHWEWALRFLLECRPGRYERNCRTLATLAAFSRDCLVALREQTSIEYDQLSQGILHFATDPREFERMARAAEAMRSLGVPRQVKTAAECLAIEPALKDAQAAIAGGIYTPTDESGDACRFTRELARLAVGIGVGFRYGASIEALEVAGGEVSGARLADGRTLSADAYVVALGSYSPLLLAPLGVRLPIYPLKGYSITLPLGPAEEVSAPIVSLTDEAHKIVLSRLGSRLRAAGTAEMNGYDTSINESRCAAIARRVLALFPALGGINRFERWAGLRPATPGNVPLIGRTRIGRLFLNTGHGTLGWTLACGSAKLLADLVGGRRPPLALRFDH